MLNSKSKHVKVKTSHFIYYIPQNVLGGLSCKKWLLEHLPVRI